MEANKQARKALLLESLIDGLVVYTRFYTSCEIPPDKEREKLEMGLSRRYKALEASGFGESDLDRLSPTYRKVVLAIREYVVRYVQNDRTYISRASDTLRQIVVHDALIENGRMLSRLGWANRPQSALNKDGSRQKRRKPGQT